jgi:UDP-glucose 4-epimerase
LANLLITGGAGFIGSHTCLELLQAGHALVVLDNFSNSGPEALGRVAELAGLGGWRQQGARCWRTGEFPSRLCLRQGDVRSEADLREAFREAGGAGEGSGPQRFDAVLHFAGLKSVGESVRDPLRYWDVNLGGSRSLLAAMQAAGCRTLVFSSSATLYGFPEVVPIAETAPVQPINPYGHSKAAVEQLLADLAGSTPGWRIAKLRYFNPVGAHPSGRLGEDPCGVPTNLFPLMGRVAVGRRPRLQVFGADWPTPDGTGVRDYVHVMDLAEGHRAALDLLLAEPPQLLTLNLGSGHGHSVLEVVRAFEAASGRPLPYELTGRRAGDAAISVADPSLAERRMGWRTSRSLAAMCRDGWAWQSANPDGYGG